MDKNIIFMEIPAHCNTAEGDCVDNLIVKFAVS